MTQGSQRWSTCLRRRTLSDRTCLRIANAFTVTIVGLTKRVRTGNGLTVNPVPAKKMAQLPDLLVMPALGVKTPDEIIDTVRGHAALDLISESHANGTELAGACTGTFFLAESGILDGLLATTSWWLGPAFRTRYPAVLLDETRIIAQDAQITTAGAAFAHIDLALSIVQQHSPSLADLTARYLLIGDPPSQAAFAVPAMLARADPTMAAFEQWVRQRLSEPLQISAGCTRPWHQRTYAPAHDRLGRWHVATSLHSTSPPRRGHVPAAGHIDVGECYCGRGRLPQRRNAPSAGSQAAQQHAQSIAGGTTNRSQL